MDKNKKGNGAKISLIAVITVLFITFSVSVLNRPTMLTALQFTAHITIENGKLVEDESSQHVKGFFEVKRSGTYVVHMDWWPEEDPGYITGFYIKKGDEVKSWVTGNKLTADFSPQKYEPGIYDYEFVILTNDDEYNAFAESFGGEYTTSGDKFEGYRDGAFDVRYNFRVDLSTSTLTLIFASGCVVYGLLLGLLLFSLCYKGGEKPEYDERQKLVIGNGYKYAFFTLFALLLIYSVLDYSGMGTFMSPAIFCEAAIIVGASVFAVYTTVYDGYFAVNAVSGRVICLFVVLLLVNLVSAISFAVNGKIFVNGHFEVGIIFILLTALLATLLITFFVKRCAAKGEEEE